MPQSFFSVIIPTFNQGDFLNKAIGSVFNQKFKDFEIIIIDNNSTDNTQEVINNFDQKKIIYKKIKNDGIIAKSRNLGIKNSNGIWLAFLDSDDEWHENKLNETYSVIKNSDAEVICTSMWLKEYGTNKKKIYRYGPYTKQFYKNLLIFGNCVSISASTVSKNFITKNNINFNERKDFVTTEDFDFFLNISRKNGKFFFINTPLGKHFIHPESASSNFDKHYDALFSVLNDHVFKIQRFDENKEKLWSEVEANYNLRKIIQKLKANGIKGVYILQFIKILIKNPKNNLNFLFKIIKNKFLNLFSHSN